MKRLCLLFVLATFGCDSNSSGDEPDATSGPDRGKRDLGPIPDALPPEDLGFAFFDPPACRQLPACCDMLAAGDQPACRTTVNRAVEVDCRTVLDRQRFDGVCSVPADIGPACTAMAACCALQAAGEFKEACIAQTHTANQTFCQARLDALNAGNLCSMPDSGVRD